MKKLMALLILVVFGSLLFIINCSNRNPTGGGASSGSVEQVQITVPPSFKAPSGIVTIDISAAALDMNGIGVPNVPIQFSLDPQIGQISYDDTLHQTDNAGNITVIYTANLAETELSVSITATVLNTNIQGIDTISITPLDLTIDTLSIDPVHSVLYIGQDISITDTLKVTVKDSTGSGISGVLVNFNTTHGTIENISDTTNSGGIFKSLLTIRQEDIPAGDNAVTTIIKASIGSNIDSTAVTVIRQTTVPTNISITADPQTMNLMPGQEGICELTITVTDSDGVGVPGFPVDLSTNGGSITAADPTDAAGQTKTTLKSWAAEEPVTVTSTVYYVPPNSQDTTSISGDVDVNFISIESTISSFDVWADPSILNLSSGASAIVKAQVRDEDNLAIPGLQVVFWSDKGTLFQPQLTDSSGTAQVTFTPFNQIGPVVIWAKAGSDSDFTTVQITLPSQPTNVFVFADPQSMKLVQGQVGTSLITVTVTDSNGVALPGLSVEFTTDEGAITSASITNIMGQTQATLSSAAVSDSIHITATVVYPVPGTTDTLRIPGYVSVLFVELEATVKEINAWSSPSTLTLVSGENSVISARVIDTNNAAIAGLQVDFWTTQGAISAPTLTDSAGVAQVTFYPNNQLGTATIWSKVGDDSSSTTVSVTSVTLPDTIVMNANPSSMKLVEGQIGSSEITMTVNDVNGVGLPGISVNLSTSGGSLTAPALTNNYGQTTTTLSSTALSESAIVTANITYWDPVEEDSSTITNSVDVSFIPLESTIKEINVWSSPSTLTIVSGENSIISARVIDTNNAAISGLKVDFRSTQGAISAPTLTDSAGVAQVTFYPNNELGTSTIWATVGSDSDFATVEIFQTDEPSSIILSADPQTMQLAQGQAGSSNITITVINLHGVGIPGMEVELSTDIGFVTAALATDSSGQTSTVLSYSVSSQPDTAHVTATVSFIDHITLQDTSISNSVEIIFIPLESTILDINVWADPATITLASGTASTIRARVIDTNYNAVTGLQVSFRSTEFGALTPPSLTDSAGIATTYFYSNNDTGTTTIWAKVGEDSASTEVTVTTSATSGSIWIGSSQAIIYADGNITYAYITARLRDSDGVGIPGDTLDFHSMPIFTSITANVVTDSMGEAHAVFNDLGIPTATPEYPDSAAYIWATHSGLGLVSDTIHIIILEAPDIGSVTLYSPGVSGMTANGSDTTSVEATVTLADGNRAPYGTQVHFEAVFATGGDAGTLAPTDTITNDNGMAKVKFVSAVSTDTVWITADVEGIFSDPIAIPHRAGAAAQINLVSAPEKLYVRGIPGEITIVVQDSIGNPVNQVYVNWTASLGSITQSSLTDVDGLAIASLSPQTQAGISLITVKVTGIADSLTFGVPIEAGNPSSIELTSNVDQIQVQGTGGQESATLSALVRDPNGNPVPDSITVVFQLLPPSPPDASFDNGEHIDSSTTIEGAAMVSLNSGLTSGPVKVKAMTWTPEDTTRQDTIWAQKSNLVIASGPPHDIYIDYSDDVEATDASSGLKIEVNARVVDEYGNNVSSGTAVWFSVVPDSISPWYNSSCAHIDGSSTIMDSTGIAYTNLYYTSFDTFDSLDVKASCTTGDTTLATATALVILPLYEGEAYLTTTPEAYWFIADEERAVIECYAVLKDGHKNEINNALISFNNTVAMFFFYDSSFAAFENGNDYTLPQYRRFTMYTGPDAYDLLAPEYGGYINWPSWQAGNHFPDGVAKLYLRAIEYEYEHEWNPDLNYPGIFFDTMTPQAVGDVHANVVMFPDVTADAANITFLRTP